MAYGFAGGFTEGFGQAQTRALAERAQTEQTEIARGQLGIAGKAQALRERAQYHQERQDDLKRGDAIYNDLTSFISESIKQMRLTNQSPDRILGALKPHIQAADQLGPRLGRPPGAVANGAQALIAATPTAEEAAAAVGRGKASSTIAETSTLNKAVGMPGGITEDQLPLSEDKKRKIEIGLKIADNYARDSKQFNTISEYYDRIKSSSNSPAGNIGLIFSFIKMLDPTSTVSPGEQATARNTATVPEQVRMIYNKMLGDWEYKGGQWVQKKENVEFLLTKEQVADFKNEAKIHFDNARRRQDQVDASYVEMAKRAKTDPAFVVPGYTGPKTDFPMETPSGIGFKVVK